MALTSSLNYDVVHTLLDSVWKQEFDLFVGPGIATVETPAIFKQATSTKSQETLELFKGTGLWQQKGNQQDIKDAQPRVANQITFKHVTWANSVSLDKEFFDDDQHEVYTAMVSDLADTARVTREMTGFGLYRNATTTTLTADGVAWGSASHTNINGDTVSNLITSSALTDATLQDAIQKLFEMKAQDGTIRSSQPKALLVPPALFKTAKIITQSELRSGTANNDMNVYQGIYGLEVYQSAYIGAAAGGSDSTWFLLGRNHSVYRWVREGISTYLNDYTLTKNHNYVYGGRYRESYGVKSYEGSVIATA